VTEADASLPTRLLWRVDRWRTCRRPRRRAPSERLATPGRAECILADCAAFEVQADCAALPAAGAACPPDVCGAAQKKNGRQGQGDAEDFTMTAYHPPLHCSETDADASLRDADASRHDKPMHHSDAAAETPQHDSPMHRSETGRCIAARLLSDAAASLSDADASQHDRPMHRCETDASLSAARLRGIM
jgi:hypothetical protein